MKGWDILKKFSRFITLVFLVIFLGIMIISLFFGNMGGGDAFSYSIYYALIITGIPIAFKYFHNSLHSLKKKMWFLLILVLIYFFYIISIIPFLYFPGFSQYMTIGDMALAAELLALKYLFLNLLLSFSIAYIVFAFAVTYLPVLLNHITNITSVQKHGNKNSMFKTFKYSTIRFLFKIPRFVDTQNLILKRRKGKGYLVNKLLVLLPVETMLTAMLVLYIGLNPFLPTDLNRIMLIDISLNIASLIPLLVLPVYIFYLLRPFISVGKGNDEGFYIHKGLKERLVGILITATTIIFILRLALERVSTQIFILAGLKLLIALPGLLLSSIVFIMVFEKIIVKNTFNEFRKQRRNTSSFLDKSKKVFRTIMIEDDS